MVEAKTVSFKIANETVRVTPSSEKEAREVAFASLMANVIQVIERIMTARGISRRELAKRIGKSESTISRQLDGEGNLQVDTIAHMFWALDDKPYISSAGYDCMSYCGMASDLRPIYTDATAPGWIKAVGAACIGSARPQLVQPSASSRPLEIVHPETGTSAPHV